MKRFTLGKLQVLFITIILLIAISSTTLLLNHNTDNNNIHGKSGDYGILPEPLNLSILDPNINNVNRPIEYYELSDGTILEIEDRNPFPFTIEISSNEEIAVPNSIGVYKVELYNDTSEVMELLSELGASQQGIEYNQLTGTYLYSDNMIRIEYSPGSGFFRIIPVNNSGFDYNDFVSNRLLNMYPDNIVFKREYKPSSSVNGHNTQYSVVYTGYLDGIPTPLKIIVILGEDNRTVHEIQGLIVKRLIPLDEYNTIPIDLLPELLHERVSGEYSSNDWYISKLGFTQLTINNIDLTYIIVTGKEMLVPVYKFSGEWILNYDNINSEGELYGTIIAVYGK